MEIPICLVNQSGTQSPEELTMFIPKRGSKNASGIDLVAANREPVRLLPQERALVPTGIAIALPLGLEAQVRPRSGLALKHGVTVLNSPGTIDADYRGEIKVILINHGQSDFVIERGMRIAQLVVARVELVKPVMVTQLPASDRGEEGFGSTGGLTV